MLRRVFDLFTQVDGSQQYASGGMGIGLTLVQRLVEQHGGEVRCESEGPGTGSEFIVRLPLATGPRLAGTAATSDSSRGAAEPAMLRVRPIPKSQK
jgi:K+-sensing histidine kinase KdpD